MALQSQAHSPGAFTNNGTIKATATADSTDQTASAEAYAILINSSTIGGLLTNTGTIKATAAGISASATGTDGSDGYAEAYGIYATNGSTLDGILNTSTGTITATATAEGQTEYVSATAIAIEINNTAITNAITNNGTITATATATGVTDSTAEAEAYAISLEGGASAASLANTGTITAKATVNGSTYEITAEAYGIYLSGSDITGTLSNTGTIKATAIASIDASSSATATAYGLRLTSTSSINAVTNDGTISASATGNADTDEAYGFAYGVALNGSSSIATTFTNDGTISGTATATAVSDTATARAYGLQINGASDITGGLTNNGTITATATAKSGDGETVYATAYGIYVEGAGTDITGGVTNTGTIQATATGTGSSANAIAYGIIVSNVGANITGGIDNSGTIIATASGEDSQTAYGIYVDTAEITGGITNTGIISGADGAIFLQGLQGATPIQIDGGRIIGDVTDNAIANGFSDTTINADFTTEGDWTVSDLTVTMGNTLTISHDNDITIDDMSTSGGTFNFGIGSAAESSSLTVATGNLDFTGATITATVTGAGLADGDEILIATGATTITAGPGNTLTDIDDDSFLWSFQIADGTAATAATNDTDLFLFATQESTIAAAATTGTNATIGAVLDGLAGSANTQVQTVISSINNASTQAEVDAILSQVAPTVNGGGVFSALTSSNTSLGLTSTRLASLRQSGGTGVAAGSVPTGTRFWGQLFGQSGEQDLRDGIDGFDTKTYGLAFGVDSENILDKAVIGISLSYADTDVDGDGSANAQTDVDSYQFTLYGDYDLGHDTFVNGMVAYSRHDTETSRLPAAGIIAKGDYDADQYTIRAELGRDYDYKGFDLTPSVLAHYTHYNPEEYTETGAGGLNATIDGDSLNIFELGLGIDASWTYKTDNGGMLKPKVNAGYRYDFIGDEFAINSQLAGGGATFKSEGFDPAQSTFTLGTGVKYYDTNNWEFTADYDYEFKSDYDSHSALLKAAYKF